MFSMKTLLILGLGLLLSVPAIAQSDYTLKMIDGSSYPGVNVDVPVILDSSAGIEVNGWSWGVCIDPTEVEIIGDSYGSALHTLNGGVGPDFYQVTVLSDGWIAAGVSSFFAASTLAPSDDHELIVMTYRPLIAGTIDLPFCDTIGSPPVMFEIVVPGSSPTTPDIVPDVIDGAIISQDVPIVSFSAPDAMASYPVSTGVASFDLDVSIEETAGLPSPSEAFSMGLSHSPSTLINPTNVEPSATLAAMNGGSGPDFFEPNLLSDGWTVGVIYSFSSSESLLFPTATPVVSVTYMTAASLAGDATGAQVDLLWSNALGSPPVFNEVLADGLIHSAGFVNGTLDLIPSSGANPFVRGDCNQDGQYDIADAVGMLQVLFGGVPTSCSEACNANGGTSLDLSDAVFMLTYLLGGGASPPSPFAVCGGDGGNECQFAACP